MFSNRPNKNIRKNKVLKMMRAKYIECPIPSCRSLDVWNYGFYYTQGEKKQKYKCKKCGHVWREK